MRILVTGACGFIGGHVASELALAGHEVHGLDNLSTGVRENLAERIPFYSVEVRDAFHLGRVFDEFKPDAVCHLAAQISVGLSVHDPRLDADINIGGLLNVLEHSVRTGVKRVIFASSGGALYGEVTEPADESHPCAPISPYGISKLTGEQYLRFFAAERGLAAATALRFANVYGPRQNHLGDAGVVAIFSRKMLAGQPVTIHGDGRSVRDYVYVGDVARAVIQAVEQRSASPFAAYNIGTGRGTDVNQLATLLSERCAAALQKMGRPAYIPSPQHGPPRPGDLKSNRLQCDLARRELGWQPAINLEDGLERTVAWFASRELATG